MSNVAQETDLKFIHIANSEAIHATSIYWALEEVMMPMNPN